MFDNDHSYTPEGFLAQKIILISSMSFLGINYGMGLLLTFFLFFDTLFGIAKAITLYGWVAVNKNKLLFGIGTKVLVLFIPIGLRFTCVKKVGIFVSQQLLLVFLLAFVY
jgi:hypothetical protein